MKSVRLSLIGNKHPSFINDSLCRCYKKLWSEYKKFGQINLFKVFRYLMGY